MARFSDAIDLDGRSHIKALLGPTNTGKTHRAIQRMLHYKSGMIGLPLRLLAREVYDRVRARAGDDKVALVTGEERIVPPGARYFCCTVESMPLSTATAFLAVDEIQLATHRERGHTFTDRLLHARGVKETWFLGSDTMIPIVEQLVPTAEIVTYPRLSSLRYTGVSRLTALQPRSAVVAFSASHVYELAEQIRARRGGTAVVLGALSPRARNAQVAMYQAGEVRYLVSTDAIGMGLNLDINHITLGATHKFDGHGYRPLSAAEIGQIAGRAGRFKRDGTFGITTACAEKTGGLDATTVEAVESQRFAPVRRVHYRNSDLDFSSPDELLASLLAPPPRRILVPVRDVTDQRTLDYLLKQPGVRDRAGSASDLELLWEVCRVPDFRRVLVNQHAVLVRSMFEQLQDRGTLDEDWLESRLARLDRTSGGEDMLMTRIAFVRTWTYVANRSDWLADRDRWRARTRQIEDRLSDALHEALTQRFVDQRSVVLTEKFDTGLPLEAELTEGGELRAAGVQLGRLEGFRFVAEADAAGRGLKLVLRAARQALSGPLAERVATASVAPHGDLVLEADGRLRWQGGELARLQAGATLWAPVVRPPRHELLSTRQREALRARALQWVKDELLALSSPLEADGLTAPARGLLYQLKEGLGSAARSTLSDEIAALSKSDRKALFRMGVKLGMHAVYAAPLLKPAQLRRRAWLWSLAADDSALIPAPSGSASLAAVQSSRFYAAVGYRRLGPRAVRLDMVERLDAELRGVTRKGAAPLPEAPMSWLGCSRDDLAEICRSLGYSVHGEEALRIERPRRPRSRGRRS